MWVVGGELSRQALRFEEPRGRLEVSYAVGATPCKCVLAYGY